jgi:hypothetical protein
MHGFGIYTSASSGGLGDSSSRQYEGGWEHDAPSGFGVEIKTAPAGPDEGGGSRYYEGEWVEGVRHGHGIELWPDGRRYVLARLLACVLAWSLCFLVARCVDDWFDRSTPLIWIACTWTGRYEGEWLDDAQHGEGVTSTAQGEVGQQSIGCTQRAAPDTMLSGLIEAPLQYPRKHPHEFASPPANACAAVFVFKQPTACWGRCVCAVISRPV